METNDEYEQLKQVRKRAIAERDGVSYLKATWALGEDEDEVPDLADEGWDQLASEQGMPKNGSLEGITMESSENPVLEGLKKARDIINRAFPELLSGERISAKEYYQRFKELRETGWEIKPYSKLNAKESSSYFSQLKNKINAMYREEISGQKRLF